MRSTEETDKEVHMKKILSLAAVVLAFLCNNEILTLFLIALGAGTVAVIIIAAWAKTEKKSLPGSFDTDWGRK